MGWSLAPAEISSYQSDLVVRFDGVTGAFEAVAAQGNGLDGPVYLISVPEPCGGPMLIAGFVLAAFRRTRSAPPTI